MTLLEEVQRALGPVETRTAKSVYTLAGAAECIADLLATWRPGNPSNERGVLVGYHPSLDVAIDCAQRAYAQLQASLTESGQAQAWQALLDAVAEVESLTGPEPP